MEQLDSIILNYNKTTVLIVNISLAFIMVGVAMGLTVQDFKNIVFQGKPLLVGLLSQFILLPFLTFLLIVLLKPIPSIALGMMMVAACPGGIISNFITSLANGNAALSISLTAVSSLVAIIMTPVNLGFWGSIYEPTASILQTINLDIFDVFITIFLILGVPLMTGMTIRNYYPKFTAKAQPVMRVLSIFIFFMIVIGIFVGNLDNFFDYIHYIILIVFLHNAVALFSGFQLANVFGLSIADRRSLAIETGIQNSGLGLLLIITFFGGMGGMALVAAWWGIWHIVTGLAIGFFWGSRKISVK